MTLNGVVSDDGLPATGTLSSNWSVVSAPTGATVLFTDATLAQTSVIVDVVGIYELELSANDGELSAVDTMLITVSDGVSNTVPTVDAGADETLDLQQGSSVTLTGVVSDDGLPATGTLSSNWSVVSAPTGATVLFTDATLAQTSVIVLSLIHI